MVSVIIGSIIAAAAFTGANYIGKSIYDRENDPSGEMKRHNLALEKYEADLNKYQENKNNLEKWKFQQEKDKINAEKSFQYTARNFKIYSEMLDAQQIEPPNFNDYYQPNETQKKNELIFVGLGGLGVAYVISKII